MGEIIFLDWLIKLSGERIIQEIFPEIALK